MSALFPDSPSGKPGYDKAEVDDFLARARAAYEGSGEDMGSSDIRQKVFTAAAKGGYDTKAVDDALWRLEEAFASRERDEVTEETGEAGYYKRIRAKAQEILDRVARPRKEKFRRSKSLQPGYHPADVDIFCDRLVRYFQGQEALSVATVRNQKFRTKLGGYDELQVDRVLDETVAVILAVR